VYSYCIFGCLVNIELIRSRGGSLLFCGDIAYSPHIQLVVQSLHEGIGHCFHLNVRPAVFSVLDCSWGVLMDQLEDDAHLLERAQRGVQQEVLPLLDVLGFDDLLGFFLLLFFLQIVLGLRLRNFHDFFCWYFFFGSSSLVGGVFDFDAGDIVSDHFFGHFFQFLSLFVNPLIYSICYVIKCVVHFAVVPDELDIGHAGFHCLVLVVRQILLDGSQIHGSFDDEGVVDKSEGFVVDGLPELEGVLGVEEGLDELQYFFLLLAAHEGVAAKVPPRVHVDVGGN
jgi:hypothetical protein